MRFSKDYVANVLNENFEDAKAFFLSPLLSIHYAHLVMLASCGIVSPDEARRLRSALDSIDENEVRCVSYDGTYEDLFFYVERLIVNSCGEDIAGKLHTARSRNDIDMTMYRMRQRGFILDLLEATLDLRQTLLAIAARHRETVFPAHTHTQPAQPSTVAHYLLAVVEEIGRDAERLRHAYEATNRCPLGACAITGTGFAIDRHLTSDLLGFAEPTCNTYGSIATVDYLLESLGATAVVITGLGRFLQDLLLWCTIEVQYLRLPDGFVQGSSIMPQKRNPVALEHARALASKALGETLGVTIAVHNTPFGDIVDTEDDLQPLVHAAFNDATRAVRLVAAAMKDADFNKELMEARAAANWITITELADTLVREHGVAFRQAHAVAKALIAGRERNPEAPLSRLLAAASQEVAGVHVQYSEPRLTELLSPLHFVRVRQTYGGPAPEETARAAAVASDQLTTDQALLADARGRLADAARRLQNRAAQL